MIEYVEDLTELPNGEHYGEIYKDQVETVVNKDLETSEEIKVNDIIMGQQCDNLDKWFEECVFTDDDLSSRSYELKYAKKDLKGLKPELIKMMVLLKMYNHTTLLN